MKIKISVTTACPYKNDFGIERTHIDYEDVLGVHEYESIEKCILYLKERTRESEYVVSYENNQWEVEIYNGYRE